MNRTWEAFGREKKSLLIEETLRRELALKNQTWGEDFETLKLVRRSCLAISEGMYHIVIRAFFGIN